MQLATDLAVQSESKSSESNLMKNQISTHAVHIQLEIPEKTLYRSFKKKILNRDNKEVTISMGAICLYHHFPESTIESRQKRLVWVTFPSNELSDSGGYRNTARHAVEYALDADHINGFTIEGIIAVANIPAVLDYDPIANMNVPEEELLSKGLVEASHVIETNINNMRFGMLPFEGNALWEDFKKKKNIPENVKCSPLNSFNGFVSLRADGADGMKGINYGIVSRNGNDAFTVSGRVYRDQRDEEGTQVIYELNSKTNANDIPVEKQGGRVAFVNRLLQASPVVGMTDIKGSLRVQDAISGQSPLVAWFRISPLHQTVQNVKHSIDVDSKKTDLSALGSFGKSADSELSVKDLLQGSDEPEKTAALDPSDIKAEGSKSDKKSNTG